ncbi:MAG: type II CAAX endopeptidase family protein [Myxococcales bacterium]|jgi:membrane protease YdiL (CAAX protease family)
MAVRVGLLLSIVLVAGGLALSARRVLELERGELELETPTRSLAEWRERPGATRISVRLAQVELVAGDEVVFELCSDRPMEPARWQDSMELAVLAPGGAGKLLHVPLDAPHLAVAKRNGRGACLQLGSGTIEAAGEHELHAVWPSGQAPQALMDAGLRARVLARPRRGPLDVLYVMAIALGAALFLGLMWLSSPARSPGTAGAPGRRVDAAVGGLAFIALAATTQLPLYGSTMALVKGGVLVAVQVGLSLALVRAGRRQALALQAPRRPLAWLGVAVASAGVLWIVARVSLRLVPATGEAPIQTFVSWPSGMLSFAALGVILPVAEELFFRGYLYRATLPLGRAAAFVITVALFIGLHAQQSWGNWGGLLAIGVTGVGLTALRALSGSVLVPAVAHLLYNFALSVASF